MMGAPMGDRGTHILFFPSLCRCPGAGAQPAATASPAPRGLCPDAAAKPLALAGGAGPPPPLPFSAEAGEGLVALHGAGGRQAAPVGRAGWRGGKGGRR